MKEEDKFTVSVNESYYDGNSVQIKDGDVVKNVVVGYDEYIVVNSGA